MPRRGVETEKEERGELQKKMLLDEKRLSGKEGRTLSDVI